LHGPFCSRPQLFLHQASYLTQVMGLHPVSSYPVPVAETFAAATRRSLKMQFVLFILVLILASPLIIFAAPLILYVVPLIIAGLLISYFLDEKQNRAHRG
jgi:hypothetical protein